VRQQVLVTGNSPSQVANHCCTGASLAGFVDLVAISIDGLPQEHDQIRGQCGAFNQALAGLEVIRASGVPFAFIFTLTQFNVDSLGFVVELAAACGANGVQVHPLTLYGRAASLMADAHPDELELLAAICESIRLGENLGITVIIDAISQQQLLEYRDHFVPSRSSSDLTDISPTLILQQDGTVVPLTHNVNPSLWLGSLHQESLSSMSDRWLKTGRSAELVQACEKTWDELTTGHSPAATYWFDEVAARTNP
jgi:MoaA/NifB/PqqE/SkfB family radical SAM enzyme